MTENEIDIDRFLFTISLEWYAVGRGVCSLKMVMATYDETLRALEELFWPTITSGRKYGWFTVKEFEIYDAKIHSPLDLHEIEGATFDLLRSGHCMACMEADAMCMPGKLIEILKCFEAEIPSICRRMKERFERRIVELEDEIAGLRKRLSLMEEPEREKIVGNEQAKCEQANS